MSRIARFSVVVPVHNGARFLREALDSIGAQSVSSWDCTIVEDASTDESYSIAREWALARQDRARIIRHHGAPRGEATSRNEGIAASRGSWISFLDQDDVWVSTKLQHQERFIEENPQITAVGCLPILWFDGIDRVPFVERWVDMTSAVAEKRAGLLGLVDFVAACPFCLSGVTAQRNALLELGGFDPSLPRTCDWMLWARFASRGRVGLIRRPLVHYRLHGENEMLRLAAEPLGLAGAFLEMRTHLADWLAEDRGLSRARSKAHLDGLIRDAAVDLLPLARSELGENL